MEHFRILYRHVGSRSQSAEPWCTSGCRNLGIWVGVKSCKEGYDSSLLLSLSLIHTHTHRAKMSIATWKQCQEEFSIQNQRRPVRW